MIHELEKEKMDALRAVADANMKASEARVALSKLKEDEAKYLKEREKLAFDLIASVIAQSKELLKDAYANYDQIRSIEASVSQLSKWVIDTSGELSALFEDFKKQQELWNTEVRRIEQELAQKREENRVSAIRILNDRQALDRKEDHPWKHQQ